MKFLLDGKMNHNAHRKRAKGALRALYDYFIIESNDWIVMDNHNKMITPLYGYVMVSRRALKHGCKQKKGRCVSGRRAEGTKTALPHVAKRGFRENAAWIKNWREKAPPRCLAHPKPPN
jgi:hypothetical protein